MGRRVIPAQTLSSRIPQELFINILNYIDAESFVGVPSRSPDTFHLSSCSLVCRYWGRMTRRKLFSRIVFRSAKDVDRLGALISSASSISSSMDSIATLVQHIFIELDGHGPWLHRIPLLISPRRTSRSIKIALNIHHMRGGDERSGTMSTLHFGLPHNLPSYFSPITAIFLGKRHFHDGVQLMKILCSLPALEEIFMEDIKWNIFPGRDTFCRHSLGEKVHVIDSITMRDFPSIWLLPALISCRHRPHVTPSRIGVQHRVMNLEDYHTLVDAFADMKGRMTVWGQPSDPTKPHRTSIFNVFNLLLTGPHFFASRYN